MRAVIAAALGFLALGYGGILLSRTGNGIAVLWPATVFGLCMILRWAKDARQSAVMLAAMFAAGFCANALGGSPPLRNAGFSLVNVAQIALALAMVKRMGLPRFFPIGRGLAFGVAAGVVPAALGGILAGLLVWILGGDEPLAAGRNWFFANLLAFLMLFAFGMAVSARRFAKLNLRRRIPEALAVLAAAVAASLLAFGQQRHALDFLLLPAVLIATVRFRLLGAGVVLVVAAAIAFAFIDGAGQPDAVARIQFLQLLLGVCSLVSVRAAGIFGERDVQAAQIERRRRHAARASRFKSRVLSHVSHEVRSPLSAIIGFSAMLESGKLSPERAPEFAAIIAHNGELLRRLHDDLLDLGRAEAGALSIMKETVAIASCVRQCVSAIRLDATLGGKDVMVERIEETLAVRADPLRLAQILNNLIANAYKYGDNFSPIRVRASALDGYGRIEVVNAGPGIPPGEHDKLFQPFMRTEPVGRRVPGAGLGLSIARMLAEAQGGRIDFESVPGRQTRFWIDLPLAA